MDRKFNPIFVVGSARSGTTLTARLIFSHWNCFEYRAESLMLSVCKLKYGDVFQNEIKRSAFLRDWFNSRQFKVCNLDRAEFIEVLKNSRNYEELLVRFLNKMCENSETSYIVDSTPAHGLFISNIITECPSAKFINIIRDPRSVAVSQCKLGWSNPPFPFKSKQSHLHYSVVQWKDLLERVESEAKKGKSICMIRYEDLISNTEATIRTITSHLSMNHRDLDASIISTGSDSNSAFGDLENKRDTNNPLNRWKSLDEKTASRITYGCGEILRKHGYSQEAPPFSPMLHIRYLYFKAHVKIKRLFVRLPYFGKFISSSLELLG